MKSNRPSRIPIQVGPERLLDALRTISIYDAPPGTRAARHFLDYAHATAMRVDLCWALLDRDSKRIGPAVIVVPNRGRTGMIFVSPPERDEEVHALVSLLEHVHQALDPAEVVLMQGLCRPQDKRTIQAMQSAGLTFLAELDYLQASLRSKRMSDTLNSNARLSFSDYDPMHHDEIKQILEESYVETRDCPGLCGLRLIDDILCDHIGLGVSDPALWITAHLDGKPAAILMLNPLPEGRLVELSYIGVAHWARGHAIARQLLQIGFDRLRQRSYETIVLAVDHANEPARRLYDALGFHRTDRRNAFIRSVGPPTSPAESAPLSGRATPVSQT